MISEKLLSLLGTFSKYELNRFAKYVHSPFFNENEELCILYDSIDEALRISHPSKREAALQKEKIWQKVFKNKPYQDIVLRRYVSDLIQLLYDYLGYQQLQKQPEQISLYNLMALGHINQHKHFDTLNRQVEGTLQKTPYRDAQRHYHLFEWESQQQLFLDKSNPQTIDFTHLLASDYHLDCFYITKKLLDYSSMLGYQKQKRIEGDIYLWEGFWEMLPNSPYFEEPAVRVYYLVIQMLRQADDVANYQALKQYVFEKQGLFRIQELNIFYIHLINYCISVKINNGDGSYFKELFEIYQLALSKETFFENGLMPPNHYKNISSIGLHLKEFAWTEQFIQDYTSRLPEGNQDNALNYNLAKLYFHQKDYPKVIAQLNEVEYQNHTYMLGGKLMLLKTYYELQEVKALDSLLDNFRIYLMRNKFISKDAQQQYLNVVKFTKKLCQLTHYHSKEIQKVKEQIIACKAVVTKEWLLEKVKELERK